MANKTLFDELRRVDPGDGYGELGERAGLRAGAEAGAGAVRRDRLLRPHVLRDGGRAAEARARAVRRRGCRSSSRRWRSTAGRNRYMKDMPALLCAWLSARDAAAARGGVRARDRQRADAADLRSDPSFRSGGPEVVGNGSQAAGARVAGAAR